MAGGRAEGNEWRRRAAHYATFLVPVVVSGVLVLSALLPVFRGPPQQASLGSCGDFRLAHLRWDEPGAVGSSAGSDLRVGESYRLRMRFVHATGPSASPCTAEVALHGDDSKVRVSDSPLVLGSPTKGELAGSFVVTPTQPGRHAMVLRLRSITTTGASWTHEWDVDLGVGPPSRTVRAWRAVNRFFEAPLVQFVGLTGVLLFAGWVAKRYRSKSAS